MKSSFFLQHICVLILLLISCFALSPQAQTTTCMPSTISYGQIVFGDINSSDCTVNSQYSDEYTFSGSAGQQINIKYRSHHFLGSLQLLNTAGSILSQSNNSNQRYDERQITVTLPSTGNYKIRIALIGQDYFFQNVIGGNYYLSLAQGTSACSYSITNPGSTFHISGIQRNLPNEFSSTLNINTAAGCSWSAFSNDSWITVNNGNGTSGNGTVNYNISANNTGLPRRGNIIIGGLTLYVYQVSNIPCSPTPISYGQTLSAEFSASDCAFVVYHDLFTFSGNAGDQIAVSTSNVSLISTGIPIFLNMPSGTSGRPVFDIQRLPVQGYYTLPYTGTYTIDLQPDNPFDQPNGTGTYTVTLERAPATPTGTGSVTVTPINNLSLNFDEVKTAGNTYATVLSQDQIEPLPANFSLTNSPIIYNISTSAIFSGNITVTFNVPNITHSQFCDRLRLLHFVNGNWTADNNAAPVYNAATQICTVSQTVSSFSPFAVAQMSTPTAATVSIGGRVIANNNRGIRNVLITLTDFNGLTKTVVTNSLGYYRFIDIPAGQTYTISASAKKYSFTQPAQVLNLTGDAEDINFVSDN